MGMEEHEQWLRLCNRLLRYSGKSARFLRTKLGWVGRVPGGTSFRLTKIEEIASDGRALDTLERLQATVRTKDRGHEGGGVPGRETVSLGDTHCKGDVEALVTHLQDLASAVIAANSTLERSSIMYHVFQVFFPGTVYQRFVSVSKSISCGSGNDTAQIQNFSAEFTDNDELNFENNSTYIQRIVSEYTSLYSSKDKAEHEAVVLSVMKELSFDPKVHDEYEANYENSIIRSIMNNESEGSNTSSDDETKILDFNETLTFQVDVMGNIMNLIHSTLSSTTSKLRYYRPRDFDMDVSNLTTFEHNLKVFGDKNRDFKAYLIDKGTSGLCDTYSTTLIMQHLNGFEKIVKTFIILHQQSILHFMRSCQGKKILFKEEDHFSQTLNLYLNELMIFNKLLDSITLTDLIGSKGSLFDSSDSALKDRYFELLYFKERLEYEVRISNVLSNN